MNGWLIAIALAPIVLPILAVAFLAWRTAARKRRGGK